MYASGSTGASERSEALFVGLDRRSDRDDATNKTASELEQMTLARVRDEMVCPTDLQVRVIRVGGRWDAFAEVIDKEKHPDCLARMVLIASELRSRYELGNLEGTNRQRRA
jgi:hypothetical protein